MEGSGTLGGLVEVSWKIVKILSYMLLDATELPDGLILKGFLKGDLSCTPLWHHSGREWPEDS